VEILETIRGRLFRFPYAILGRHGGIYVLFTWEEYNIICTEDDRLQCGGVVTIVRVVVDGIDSASKDLLLVFLDKMSI
jgi:hypothetical protein